MFNTFLGPCRFNQIAPNDHYFDVFSLILCKVRLNKGKKCTALLVSYREFFPMQGLEREKVKIRVLGSNVVKYTSSPFSFNNLKL